MSNKKILYPYIKPTNYIHGGKRGGSWVQKSQTPIKIGKKWHGQKISAKDSYYSMMIFFACGQ